MSVQRVDLNKCVGCKNCVMMCPMDVFRFDEKARKSIIAYPENCQSCGICYIYCPGRSLTISNDMFGYAITALRAVTTVPMNHLELTQADYFEKVRDKSL